MDVEAPPPVDRDATCPFLLRLFWNEKAHHPIAAYGETPGSGVTPAQEIQLYTWEDCSLRELADMVKHEQAIVRGLPAFRPLLPFLGRSPRARARATERTRARAVAAAALPTLVRDRLPGSARQERDEGGARLVDNSRRRDAFPPAQVGFVWSTNTSKMGVAEAETKTLRDLHFQTGDYIDVAIKFPQPRPRGNPPDDRRA